MQHIDIVCFGKLKESFWRDAVCEYSKRLTAYCKLNITELSEANLSASPSEKEILNALDAEADVALKHIPSDKIKKRANYKLSFSEFTFPHQLMRVLLTEQLYRAYTIQNNTKYHK